MVMRFQSPLVYVPNVYILGALALIPNIDVINWRNAQCTLLKLNGYEAERLLYVPGVFKLHK